MNEMQKKIQSMVFEIIQAMKRYPYKPSEIEEILACLPGIEDGTFFQLPVDEQRGKLGWVNGAFFGRGERAFPLFKSGLLHAKFDSDFNSTLREYWNCT
jgi:hypothetical protein